jgi:hypothetical protein
MNKFFLASVIVLSVSGSALALTTHDETHNGKTVAVPGAQHSKGVFAPAAQVTPHGMVVTAPPGADVDVDNDEGDIQIDITPRGKSRGLLGVGFLGL